MREVLIRLPLSENEAAMFEGRNAMIVPLSDAETGELRDKIVLSHEGMMKFAKAVATLVEVLETKGSAEPEIRKLLEHWQEPSRLMASNLDRMRELLGRAKFVGGMDDGTEASE